MSTILATYVFEDIKKLATALDGIGQFRPDAYVAFSKAGISVCTIDKQHVMLIDHTYHISDMVDASFGGDEPVRMHFDVKALASTMKLAVKRGNVTLAVQASGSEKVLKVILEGSEFTVHQAPHDTRLSDSDSDLEPTRDLPAAEITMTGKEAKRIFKELLSFNTDIRISCDSGKKCMVLACDGPGGTANMTIREGWEGVQDLIITSNVNQKFDSKYLQKIIKQDVGNKMITLRMRRRMPVEVCHAVSDQSYLSFHLAPKSCD